MSVRLLGWQYSTVLLEAGCREVHYTILVHEKDDVQEICTTMHTRNTIAKELRVFFFTLTYKKGDHYDTYYKAQVAPVPAWYSCNLPLAAAVHVLSYPYITTAKLVQETEEAEFYKEKGKVLMSTTQKSNLWKFAKATQTWKTNSYLNVSSL